MEMNYENIELSYQKRGASVVDVPLFFVGLEIVISQINITFAERNA